MPSQDLDAAGRPMVGRRTAWAVVIIMTALFVLALGAVIWGFVRQARIVLAAHPLQARQSESVPASGAAAVLTLVPGAHIASVTTDAGKLVLHVSLRGGGSEVDIIDLATGKLTAKIESAPAK